MHTTSKFTHTIEYCIAVLVNYLPLV